MTTLAAVATVFAIKEQRDARKDQKKAEKARANRASTENAKARRDQVAASRRARAAAISQGENSGISGGSQVEGATGSLQSQTASNVSFLSNLENLDRARFKFQSNAADHLGRANTFQGVAQVSNTFTGALPWEK